MQVVQRVLDAMNHDAVNSIGDTIESRQIAEEARVVYYELMDRADWPHLISALQLESVSDLTRPNFLRIPEDVVRIDDVRYETTREDDTNTTFDKIKYLPPSEFMDYTGTRRTDDSSTIVVTTHTGVQLFIKNNERPHYWTTFDNEYLIFDSFDSATQGTMHGNRSSVIAKVIPPWTMDDTFTPDIPDHMFSTYVAELTSACFVYWKQGMSPVDEKRAARGISRLRKDAEKINERDHKARYGRPRNRHFVRSESGERGSFRDSLG